MSFFEKIQMLQMFGVEISVVWLDYTKYGTVATGEAIAKARNFILG